MASLLSDKVAIITGASRGLGLAIAERYLDEGAAVLITDVDAVEGANVVAQMKQPDQRIRFLTADVTSESDWQRTVEACEAEFGPPDILVNNAATVRMQPIHEETLDGWSRVVAVNLTGPFLGMRAVLPSMIARGGGCIINVSSIWGLVGANGAAAYQASKGGLALLSKNGAITYASNGIRVNSIHPGGIKTLLIEQAGVEDSVAAATPFGRVSMPSEIAGIAVYLASNDASFTTGAQFVIDGGYTAL